MSQRKAPRGAPRRPAGRHTDTPGRPGRRRGAPGHGRTQQLPVAAEDVHRPACCAACGEPLHDAPEQRAHNARYVIDLIRPGADGTGLLVQQTKQTYLEVRCACGHWTQAQPGCADGGGRVDRGADRVASGRTDLVAFICALAQRMRLPRSRIRELLHDWLGLELSLATINQCIHEAGRAVAPVVDGELHETLRNMDSAARRRNHLEGAWSTAVALGIHVCHRHLVRGRATHARGGAGRARCRLPPMADDRWVLRLSRL